MNTLEQIIELIRLNKKPYLVLKRKDGLNVVNAGMYRCENCGKDDSTDTKIENAIRWLGDYLSLFPKGTVFYLYMKSSENANQSGVLGPFDFLLKPDKNETENINDLGGVPQFEQLKQLGYVPESEVKAKLLEQELKFERELARKQIEDLKKEFNEKLDFIQSTASEWSPQNIRGLAKEIGLTFKMINGKDVPQTALAGQWSEESKQEKKPDLKAAAVNELAELMYKNASLKDIEKLKLLIKPEQKEQTNE